MEPIQSPFFSCPEPISTDCSFCFWTWIQELYLVLNVCNSLSQGATIRNRMLLLFSCPVMSNSLQPHGLQYTRPPCPSPSSEVCPSSCPLHRWCYSAISSYDAFFSFSAQSFPASGTFPTSHLFASDDQNIGASASASVLPVNIQGWFSLELTGLISLISKGLLTVFSSITVWRHQFFGALPSLQFSSHNRTWLIGRS